MESDEEIIEEADDFDSGAAQKKLKKFRDELKQCQREKASYLESLQRARADFINARKSEEEERKTLSQFIQRPLLLDIIGLADIFERAFASNKKNDDAFARGMHQIYGKFRKVLETSGVKKMETRGEFFDPAYHESVGEVEVADASYDHKIIEEIEQGYLLGELVLRPAKVKIGKYKHE